jgi:hypothetical protein
MLSTPPRRSVLGCFIAGRILRAVILTAAPRLAYTKLHRGQSPQWLPPLSIGMSGLAVPGWRFHRRSLFPCSLPLYGGFNGNDGRTAQGEQRNGRDA